MVDKEKEVRNLILNYIIYIILLLGIALSVVFGILTILPLPIWLKIVVAVVVYFVFSYYALKTVCEKSVYCLEKKDEINVVENQE